MNHFLISCDSSQNKTSDLKHYVHQACNECIHKPYLHICKYANTNEPEMQQNINDTYKGYEKLNKQ